MATSESIVFVVDDDPAVRDSLEWLLSSVDMTVQTFASAQEFMDAYDPKQLGCVLVDVRMPGMSGLELQEELAAKETNLPVIVITGHSDVQMAVRAMKSGAFDFIEKPFNDQSLLDLVQKAIDENKATVQMRSEQEKSRSVSTSCRRANAKCWNRSSPANPTSASPSIWDLAKKR